MSDFPSTPQEPSIDPHGFSGKSAAELRPQLIGELAGLRKGEGVTLTKLEQAPILMWLAHEDQQAIDRMAAPPEVLDEANLGPHEYARFFLGRQIGQLPDQEKAQALKAAYCIGMSVSPNTLTNRRKEYAGTLVSYRTPGSVDRWENKAITELALRLLGRHVGHHPEDVIAASSDLPLDERAYDFELTDITFVLGPNRTVTKAYYVRMIYAKTDGVDSFEAYSEYFSDPRLGAFDIIPLTGCALVGTEPHAFDPDVSVAKFKLRGPLNIGGSRRLSYCVLVNSDIPMVPAVFHLPSSSSGTIIIRVQFDENAPPKEPLYFFSHASRYDMPGQPTPETIVQLDEWLYAEKDFSRLQRGLAYGFAWKW